MGLFSSVSNAVSSVPFVGGVVGQGLDFAGDIIGGAGKFLGGTKAKVDYSLMPTVDKKAFMLPTGLAAAQTQRGFQQAQQAALGNIAATRGVNPALLMRQGQQASSDLYNQAMQQGQIANLQEAIQGQQGQQAYQQMLQDAGKAKLGAQVGVAQANAQQQAGLLGGLGTAIGGIAGMFGPSAVATSDKRAKKNIKSDDKTIEDVLEAFSKSKQWEYKDKENGEGNYVGPMAQDLEQAKPDMVSEADNGMKQVDMNKALMAIMAAQGHLYKKIKKIEGKKAV